MSRCLRAVVPNLIFFALAIITAFGQTTLTEQPLQAIETHGIEHINLSDLSVDLRIPVRHKSGLIPWSMVMNQHFAYTPLAIDQFGDKRLTLEGSTFRPYIEGLTSTSSIYYDENGLGLGAKTCPNDPQSSYDVVGNFGVMTSDGAIHSSPRLGTNPYPLALRIGSCPHGGESAPLAGTATTADGTGYTFHVDFSQEYAGPAISSVYDKDGNSVQSNYIPARLAGTGVSSGTGTAWSNPANVHASSTSYAGITISGVSGTYQSLEASNFGFAVNYAPLNIVVDYHWYSQGTLTTNGGLNAQLLKNGVPIGTTAFWAIRGAFGSASAPDNGVFVFPNPGLTASDINNSSFGVAITPVGGQSGYTLSIFVDDVTISPDAFGLLVDRAGNVRDDLAAAIPTAGETCQNYPYPVPCYYTFTYQDTTGYSPLTLGSHTWESNTLGGPVAQCTGTIYASPGGNCVNNGGVIAQLYLPDSLKYADASGNMVGYSIIYTTYNFLGNFGCPNNEDALKANQTAVFPTTVTYPDGSILQLAYERSFGKDSTWTTGRLKSLTLPTGGTVTYAYSGGVNGINCSDGSPATITRTTADGVTTYVHVPPSTVPPVAPGMTTVTDPYGNTTVHTFWGGTGTLPPYETQQLQKDSHGNLLRTTIVCFNGMTNLSNCADGLHFQSADAQGTNRIAEVTKYVTDSASGMSYKTDVTYDYNGSVLSSTKYDWGSSTPLEQVVDAYGSWNGTSCAQIGNYIYDEPCDIKTLDGSGHVIAETRYTYNGQGEKTAESHWTSGANWLTTTYQRNSNGTVSLKTAPGGSQVQYTYNDGCAGNYLTQELQVGGSQLTTQYAMDCNSGNTLSTIDSNSSHKTYNYTSGGADPYLRVKSITDEAGAVTSYTYGTNSIESVLSINGGASLYDRYVQSDGYGRPSLSQVKNPQSTWDTTTRLYDAKGRDAGTLLPCATQKQSPCTGAGTTIQYDALDRIVSKQDSGGGYVNRSYYGNDTLATVGPAVTQPATENLKSVQYQQDILSRLTSVCDVTAAGSGCGQSSSSATGFSTTYTRTTTTGKTTLTVAQGVQTRTYVYDALNRLVSETNPENGTTTYTYDTQSSVCGSNSNPGLMVETVTNDGTHVCYHYDALGRVLSKGNNKTAICSYYVYDAPSATPPSGVVVANTQGHLVEQYTTNANCGVTSAAVTDEWFSYDPTGRIAATWEKTPSSTGYFSVSESYYENGASKGITFTNMGPLNTISYGLDAEGRLNSVGPHFVNGTTYNANNQPLTVQYSTSSGANSDYDTLTYDPLTDRLASSSYAIGATPKTIVNNVTWNGNGSLQQVAVTDPFYAVDQNTCVYSHDDLGRLASFKCGTAWAQTFSYDQYGNLTKSGSVAWACAACYDATTNHYNKTLSSAISYDLNGDVLNDGLNQYTWDSYGRMASIFDGTATHNITYDASGREVEKFNPTREIVWGPTGKIAVMSGMSTVSSTVIPLTGDATLNISGGSNFVRHSNLNNTTTVETALYGRSVNSDKAFAPFGEVFSVGVAGSGDTSFTGMTQDTSVGAYDFQARKLLSAEGRWVNPDPSGLDSVKFGAPQTLNRYAYVANTPDTLADPLGLALDTMYCVDGDCGSEGGGWVAYDPSALSSLDKSILNLTAGQETGQSVNANSKNLQPSSTTEQPVLDGQIHPTHNSDGTASSYQGTSGSTSSTDEKGNLTITGTATITTQTLNAHGDIVNTTTTTSTTTYTVDTNGNVSSRTSTTTTTVLADSTQAQSMRAGTISWYQAKLTDYIDVKQPAAKSFLDRLNITPQDLWGGFESAGDKVRQNPSLYCPSPTGCGAQW